VRDVAAAPRRSGSASDQESDSGPHAQPGRRARPMRQLRISGGAIGRIRIDSENSTLTPLLKKRREQKEALQHWWPSHARWPERINYYRAQAGLSAVHENPQFSTADLKHARYMVKNVASAATYADIAHREDPNRPAYTPDGAAAAALSDVMPPGAFPWTGQEV